MSEVALLMALHRLQSSFEAGVESIVINVEMRQKHASDLRRSFPKKNVISLAAVYIEQEEGEEPSREELDTASKSLEIRGLIASATNQDDDEYAPLRFTEPGWQYLLDHYAEHGPRGRAVNQRHEAVRGEMRVTRFISVAALLVAFVSFLWTIWQATRMNSP